MQTPIFISGIASVSALGISSASIWQRYLDGKALFSKKEMDDTEIWGAFVTSEVEDALKKLQCSSPSYKNLDRSVLLAMLASNNAFDALKFPQKNIGINIGSSRGATALFEKYHTQYQLKGKVSPYTSPTTTLGNISSWVGQELGVNGVQIGHSVTCSTALHALLNGIAWLQAGMADAFVVGGSEAALTPFTIAQMQALKLYSAGSENPICESMHFEKKQNTMILGEGAAVAVLEREKTVRSVAMVAGYGFASEKLEHNSSISKNATCFQDSIKMALRNASLLTVDAVILHAPGTTKGDLAEKKAIDVVFESKLPLLTSNKWLVGHTFGASGMMSLEFAVLMLQHNKFIENPFYRNEMDISKELKTIMVNAVGFGGNAVSIIVSNPE
ncbi:MAG: beta-ketoacyl synthase [Flavobacteriaceae bacterium]|nr:beta-ketoacyl synthase [Flavobacteriaceae bacterium]